MVTRPTGLEPSPSPGVIRVRHTLIACVMCHAASGRSTCSPLCHALLPPYACPCTQVRKKRQKTSPSEVAPSGDSFGGYIFQNIGALKESTAIVSLGELPSFPKTPKLNTHGKVPKRKKPIRYQKGELIGHGGFGQVFLGMCCITLFEWMSWFWFCGCAKKACTNIILTSHACWRNLTI